MLGIETKHKNGAHHFCCEVGEHVTQVKSTQASDVIR